MSPRLHLLCSADPRAWRDCRGQLADGDRVVLLDRGVECLLQPEIVARLEARDWYVLRADAEARGLAALAGDRIIDDADWVRLVEAHSQILSWT